MEGLLKQRLAANELLADGMLVRREPMPGLACPESHAACRQLTPPHCPAGAGHHAAAASGGRPQHRHCLCRQQPGQQGAGLL